jgi:antitoxin MazE
MKTRLVRIGNSRGIRIPKPLIEQAGLEDEVVLRPTADGLLVQAVREPRAGWGDAAAELAGSARGGMLDAPTPTAFDEEEWTWG